MEEMNTEKKKKKSNYKKIAGEIGGALLTIAGVIVAIFIGGNGNGNNQA